MVDDKTYIKSYRSVIDHPLLSRDNSAFLVFMKLLHVCDRHTGAYTTGRFKLGVLTNLKPGTAWGALQRLENATMIRTQSNNKMTTIYICNWSKYQQPDDNKRTATRKQTDTKQELKNKEIYIDKSIYGKPEINDLFDYWKENTGLPITTQVTKNRQACNTLIKQHGIEGVQKLIRLVAHSHTDRFSPTVSNFIQLRDKQSELGVWVKKQLTTNGVAKI